MTDSTERFRQHVRAAAGIYGRIDSGQLTGRNADATDDTLDYHVGRAAQILRDACDDDTDAIWTYLDSKRGARLAATWSRIERRHAGLSV
jgi:hypothetical protein